MKQAWQAQKGAFDGSVFHFLGSTIHNLSLLFLLSEQSDVACQVWLPRYPQARGLEIGEGCASSLLIHLHDDLQMPATTFGHKRTSADM